MEDRAHAVIAGIFTLLLVAAAAMALWWFAGSHEDTRDYLVVTQQNVTGLNPQAQVRYRGIWVGKVVQINLDPENQRNILILIRIRSEVPVARGTTAKLDYQGVTGIASILLEDSEGELQPPVDGSDTLFRIPMQPSLIEELSESGGALLKEAREFLKNANDLISPDNRKNVGRTLDHIAAVSSNLGPASKNLNETIERMNRLLNDENLERLRKILENGNQASAELQPTLADARRLLQDLDRAGKKFEQALGGAGENNIAALWPRINQTARDVSEVSRQLKRTLELLEQSPQSLLFGPSHYPPGPGETGFANTPAKADSKAGQGQ